MNIQERMTAFAMLGAGWVMWFLVGLSVICVAIVIERAFFFWGSRENLSSLKQDLFRFLKERDLQGARARLEASRSFEARIVTAGLNSSEDGADSAEERMAGESSFAKLQMERYLAFLGTVGNNAPFVGLLGTVIGVIRAFQSLEQTAGQVSEGLMSEIGEALVATAIGILVALPAVAFFNLFQRVVKSRLAQADSLGREVLAYLRSKTRLIPRSKIWAQQTTTMMMS
ncbi:MAG: MotA/TolQ/ExbB proton channel family protein [Myxococcales bacterium]|nr:MAG: MotA/TolQ/ExbB proton channel family protein [Myxococcales bacterium]